MKTVLLVVAGSGVKKEVKITPGASPQDVLEQAGLQEYSLSKDGDPANIFPDNLDLYDLVENGQKIWATTKADVG